MNRFPFVLQWIIATFVGWCAGLFAWFAVVWLGWDFIPRVLIYPRILNIPFSMLNLWRIGAYILAMAVFGGCIGYAQWRIAFRERVFPGRLWTLTTAFAGAAMLGGLLIVSALGVPIMPTNSDGEGQIIFRLSDTWLQGTLILGFVMGIVIGLPQSVLLRRYVRGAHWWVLSSIAACIVTSLVFAFVIRSFGGEFLGLLIACAAIPLAFGGVTGAAMQRYLSEGS
jgi:membrane protease YdiL (CAAX protease family)